MMHFRHFLIPALMVGVSLFLPGNAFAEKNELNGQLQSKKELVQPTEKPGKAVTAPVRTKNANPARKPVAVPKPTSKSPSLEKQPASNRAPVQASTQKPVAATAKALPDQAKGNGYGHSGLEKAEKLVNPPGQEKKAVVQEEKGVVESRPTYHEDNHAPDKTVKDNGSSVKIVPTLQPQGKDVDLSNTKKLESIEPLLPDPLQEGEAPISKGEMSNADQAINQTQRSNSSGSQSNNRTGIGLSTISFSDKWFEWNKYYEIKLVQPYLSRYALMNTQWVNAPPSPPPQAAPFLKNVNRS